MISKFEVLKRTIDENINYLDILKKEYNNLLSKLEKNKNLKKELLDEFTIEYNNFKRKDNGSIYLLGFRINEEINCYENNKLSKERVELYCKTFPHIKKHIMNIISLRRRLYSLDEKISELEIKIAEKEIVKDIEKEDIQFAFLYAFVEIFKRDDFLDDLIIPGPIILPKMDDLDVFTARQIVNKITPKNPKNMRLYIFAAKETLNLLYNTSIDSLKYKLKKLSKIFFNIVIAQTINNYQKECS